MGRILMKKKTPSRTDYDRSSHIICFLLLFPKFYPNYVKGSERERKVSLF